jgi:hypothetical protein
LSVILGRVASYSVAAPDHFDGVLTVRGVGELFAEPADAPWGYVIQIIIDCS